MIEKVKRPGYFSIPGLQSTLLNVIFFEFKITYSQFASRSQKREVVCARYCFYYFMLKVKGVGCSEMETKTGVDHASVLHGVKIVTQILTGEYRWPIWEDKIKRVVEKMGYLNLNDDDINEFQQRRAGVYQAS